MARTVKSSRAFLPLLQMRAWTREWTRAVTNTGVSARQVAHINSETPYVFSSVVELAYWQMDRWARLDGIDLAVDIPRQDSLQRRDADPLGKKLSNRVRRRRYSTKRLRKKVEEAFDVNIKSNTMKKLYRGFAQDNAKLLTDLGKTHQRRIAEAVNQAQQQGWSKRRLEREIAERANITRRRARTIANDQVAKLHASAVQFLAESLGGKAYIWVTLGDDRVREEHRLREGRRYSWKHTHSDGHPGEPVNCRCIAQPTFAKRKRKKAA